MRSINRDDLLQLIEENHGLKGFDLRGAVFEGESDPGNLLANPIDLRPEALALVVFTFGNRMSRG